MRLNTPAARARPITHEGAPGPWILAEDQLRRSVMTCMLWEKAFYEDGEEISERIARLAKEVDPRTVANLAIEARTTHHLRHVPLLLCSVLAETAAGTSVVSYTLPEVIRRADELTEFLAVHAKRNGVGPDKLKPIISAQIKKGLARAFTRFDEYQLAKYDRPGAIKLRDALFLSHAKPRDGEQAAVWDRLVKGELQVPDTWEVGLSGGGDKKEVFTRLLEERKLGYLALLRNLRNMWAAGVESDLIREAILARRGAYNVLPFRFVAAARVMPTLEAELDTAMMASLAESPTWKGRTVILVDVSGSMDSQLSHRSAMKRIDVACALAAVIKSDERRVFSFSNEVVEVPPRTGMAMIDAITSSQLNWGTYLGKAVAHVNTLPHDRLIVVTDEQSHDPVPTPTAKHAYMVNIAPYRHSVGYEGGWQRVSGWSERILQYVQELEKMEAPVTVPA